MRIQTFKFFEEEGKKRGRPQEEGRNREAQQKRVDLDPSPSPSHLFRLSSCLALMDMDTTNQLCPFIAVSLYLDPCFSLWIEDDESSSLLLSLPSFRPSSQLPTETIRDILFFVGRNDLVVLS